VDQVSEYTRSGCDGSLNRDGVIERLSAPARALIESATVATVATINADGSPHLSAAWIGLDGDEIVFATVPDQRKLRNIRRDPRVSLILQGNRVNEWGLQEYMVVEGRARITEGGAADLLQKLAHTYLGPDVVFPGIPDPPPGFVTRISIERVRGVGPWLMTTGETSSTD
jgi:PPOX class probable F420-dependent enzyme